jgi:hypothetical protein
MSGDPLKQFKILKIMTKKISILVLSMLIALGATQAQTYFGDQLN